MSKSKLTISVIGLGYIGLPTAAFFASAGHRVFGVDVDRCVVDTVNSGAIHIVEPGLGELVSDVVTQGKLSAHTSVRPTDVYLICVPTPLIPRDGTPAPDLTYVYSAVEAVTPNLKAGDIVILESTCPVGTSDRMFERISKDTGSEVEVYFAYCPERVLPGRVLEELDSNPRVVGGINEESTRIVSELYRSVTSAPVFETNAKTAEMSKLAENSYRDINIAFANELSLICHEHNLDVWQLITAANMHPRVDILQPGPGVGGHCIAVDPWFIVSESPTSSRLIRTAREVNDEKPNWVAARVTEQAKRMGVNKVACFGLAFKPNIDDFRGSPAELVVRSLLESGLAVACVEPHISQHPEYALVSAQKAVEDCDLIVFLVNHDGFEQFRSLSVGPQVVTMDFCGALQMK